MSGRNPSRDFDCTRFNRAMERRGLEDQLNETELLVVLADDEGCWKPEFFELAIIREKKRFLRDLLKRGYTGEDGEHVEYMGIKETDPETGEVREGYKQLRFFTADNFEYAIHDILKTIGQFNSKLKRLCRMAVKKCGPEFQLRFDFPFPEDDGEADGGEYQDPEDF